MNQQPVTTRCGFVAVIGAPNAGKSTLVNALTGTKVSIVSHKVQTTRSRIRAIAVEGGAQIVFVDTPGIFAPRRALDRAMVTAAWAALDEADMALLMVDARAGIGEDVSALIARLGKVRTPVVLVLNKIDLIERSKLLALSQALNDRTKFAATFMISALSGDGIVDLATYAFAAMPQGPWLYPGDQVADFPMRFLAAELTREQVFHQLRDELPYASTVETESWREMKDGSVRIDQVIFVERESQRRIVLGEKGQTIKSIGKAAREAMAEAFGHKVHLFLFVKVRKNWSADPERLRMMGLVP
jgi:GTP-binding protein Era